RVELEYDSEKMFLCGTINNAISSRNDSIVVSIIERVKPDYLIPTDYSFAAFNPNTKILVSNITNEAEGQLIHKTIIKTDSIKIGVFTMFTPDFPIKNRLSPDAKFKYKTRQMISKISQELAEESDFVILISSLAKSLDRDIISGLPINAVISIDYSKTRDSRINQDKTLHYSLAGDKPVMGILEFTGRSDSLKVDWTRKENVFK
ncbi:MAG: hypothetical protein PHR06_14935, partial [Candidatus Cloacimonetes bacterium]|nr:hypothetical protein [Candidatus Cloacimonadota bacterium]